MKRTLACALFVFFGLTILNLPSVHGQEISKKQLLRAVFKTVPVANYDPQIIKDAIETVNRKAGMASIPKLNAQDIQHVIDARVDWIKKTKLALDRMHAQEEQRLRQSGLNTSQYPGQHSLLSIQKTVPIPIEFATHTDCDQSTVSLGAADIELSLQRQGGNKTNFYELVCKPIANEISLKSGFHDAQRDPNLRYLILRRAIFLHCSKVQTKEMLKKVLDEISKNENNALWVSDQATKLGEQLEHLRGTRKGWITAVIGALEQPGGLREFLLPSEFYLKGSSAQLIGSEVFSKWDLPRLRIEHKTFESAIQGSIEEQIKNSIVLEAADAIVLSLKESQTWISTFNTAERLDKDTVRWTVSLVGCSQELAKVNRVVYTLHESYQPNVYAVKRTRENDNCAFTAEAWGKFTIKITVEFVDGSTKQLEHWLQW